MCQPFPGGSEDKASARNAGDPGLIPGLGRSPGEGNGNPLQYSCLENPMDGGARWATVHGVAKSLTSLSLHFVMCHSARDPRQSLLNNAPSLPLPWNRCHAYHSRTPLWKSSPGNQVLHWNVSCTSGVLATKKALFGNLNVYPILPQSSLRSKSRMEVTAGKDGNAYPSQGRDSQLFGTRGKKRGGKAWSL